LKHNAVNRKISRILFFKTPKHSHNSFVQAVNKTYKCFSTELKFVILSAHHKIIKSTIQTIAMSQPKQPTNYGALGTLVTVFFFWGFIAAGNSVFIPFVSIIFILTSFKVS